MLVLHVFLFIEVALVSWFLQRREVYHTKRMQHVICIKWSSDNKYILSGSDEMNIRLWKANAAEKLGMVSVTFFIFIKFFFFFETIYFQFKQFASRQQPVSRSLVTS